MAISYGLQRRLSHKNAFNNVGNLFYGQGIGRFVHFGATEPTSTSEPAPGALWMDSGNAILKYNSGTAATPVWTSTASSAAQSLDGAYDNDSGERTVTVDAGSVVFRCSDASNDYHVAIYNTSTSGALLKGLHIDSVGNGSTITTGILFGTTGTSAAITTAIDASDAGITTALAIGAAAITGTNFAVSAVGAVTAVGVNYGAGALTGTGDIAISTNMFQVTGATGATTIAATLHVVGACTFDSTLNGTFTGTWAGTTWTAATITMTPSATTGDGVTITGDSVTSGNILKLHCDASLSGGYFINCMNVSTAKFTVAEDGSVTIAGTGAGTDALTLTLGDIVLTNGHVDLTDGNITIAEGKLTITSTVDESCKLARNKTGATGVWMEFETTHTGDTGTTVLIDNDGTGDGKALAVEYAGSLDAVTISAASAGDAALQITTTATTAMAIETICAASTTTSTIKVDGSTGNWIGATDVGMLHLVCDGALAHANASCLYVGYSGTGAATGLGTSIRVNDTGATATSTAVYISSNAGIALGVVGVGAPDTIVVTSAAAGASAYKCTMSAATGTALEIISAASSTVSQLAFTNSGTGATGWLGATNVGMVSIAGTGNLAHANASMLYIAYSGTGAATGLGTSIRVVDSGATNTSNAVFVSAATGGALLIDGNGTVDTITVTSAAAAASALKITSEAATGTALELVGSESQTTTLAGLTNGGAAATGWLGATGVGMLQITNTGNLAHANASCLLITYSGTGAATGLGTSLRIVDSGATATSWAAYISAATGEALQVAVGKSHFVESISVLASPVLKAGPNFIVAGGGNNALTAALVDSVGTAIPLTDGLMILVDTATYTLQAGANTLTLNGGDAKGIKLASNPGTDIGAHAASSMLHLAFNATSDVWQLLGA